MKPLFLVPLLMLGTAARANVRIVPESRNAAQLRANQADLDVQINPAARLSRVTSTWTFANTSPADFEAEFVAQAPRDAIISGFSYWFRGQKTAARIVEKERAARIYAEATTPPRPRDPALVEMLSRNFFRVRIAPVEAKKPLKIEIVWLQPVQKDGDGFAIELPWREKSSGVVVEKYALHAHFSMPVETLSSSLPGAQAGAADLRFSDEDGGALPETSRLSFGFKAPRALVQSGAKSGFFTAIVSEAAWNHRASWAGVSALHSRAVASDEVLVTGRFEGAPPASALGLKRQSDAEQSQTWWAALELDALAGNEGNRAAGIAISKRFGLPSQWTSWLAIPDAERERLFAILNRDKIAAATLDSERLGASLAKWRAAGRTNTPQFRAMSGDFNRAFATLKRDPSSRPRTLQDYYSNAAYILADSAESNARSQKPSPQTLRKLQIQVNRLVSGKEDGDGLRERVAEQLRVVERRRVAERALQGVLRGENPAKFEREIRRTFVVGDQGTNTAEAALGQAGTQFVRLRDSDPVRAARLNALMKLLASSVYPKDAANRREALQDAVHSGEYALYSEHSYSLQNQLSKEIEAKREGGARYAALRREYDALLVKAPTLKNLGSLNLSDAIQKAQKTLLRAQTEVAPDAAKIAASEAELARLSGFVEAPAFKTYVEDATSSWSGWEGTNFIADQWWQAVQKDGADSPRAAELKAALQKLLDSRRQKYNMSDTPDFHAETKLAEVERGALRRKSSTLLNAWNAERSAAEPDTSRLATLREQLEALQSTTIYNQKSNDAAMDAPTQEVFEAILAQVRAESAKPVPDAARLSKLQARLVEVADGDFYYRLKGSSWAAARHGTPQEHARLRVERIGVQSKLTRTNAQLADADQLPLAKRAALENQVAELRQLDNQLRVRMGDPLIAVAAPPSARQVLAILPGGELKKLGWNPQTARWEARFDVPTWASEGESAIQIVVVFASGARQKLTMNFALDVSGPGGQASVGSDGQFWELRLQSDEMSDRVTAFTPWNERIELRRDAAGTFSTRVAVPQEFQGQKATVRFVLTDKAHNRTEITVDTN